VAGNRADLVIIQGDTFNKTFVVFDVDGLPMQLTADGTTLTNPFTATAQLRRDVADIDTSIDATFSTTVTPIGSRVTISLAAATTLALVNGPYKYDLQVTNPVSGAITTVCGGRVTIDLEVTR
jgi:hypothetical protein